MGVIIGSRAQDAVWAQSVAWLEKRSARAAVKPDGALGEISQSTLQEKSTESGLGILVKVELSDPVIPHAQLLPATHFAPPQLTARLARGDYRTRLATWRGANHGKGFQVEPWQRILLLPLSFFACSAWSDLMPAGEASSSWHSCNCPGRQVPC